MRQLSTKGQNDTNINNYRSPYSLEQVDICLNVNMLFYYFTGYRIKYVLDGFREVIKDTALLKKM